MKKRIALLLCLASLVSVFAGCGAKSSEEAYVPTGDALLQEDEELPTEAAVMEEETLVLAYYPNRSMNPLIAMNFSNRVLFSLMYQGLFAYNSKNQTVPILCSRYRVSSDSTVYTFYVDEKATFSDGSRVTIGDVIASYDAAKQSDYYKGRFTHIVEYKLREDGGLTFYLDTPYQNLPLLLDIPIIKDGSRDEAVPLGSGPYVMDGDTRLVRNTNWWQTAAPIVDFAEVKLTLVEKTSEVRDNFEYENVNLVLTDPNSAAFAGFHNDYELWDARLPIMQYIGYNITSKVFSNYGLRSAITYAIDRDHLATDIMGGFAQPAVLPASPQAPFYDGKLANTYGYNLTKFSQQLESASVEDMDNDGTLDLYVPSLGYAVSVAGTMIVCSSSYQRVEAATEVVNALNALGFKITLKTLELSEFRQALQTGNFDLYYGEIRLSNNFDLTPFFSASGSMCYGGLDDSVMLNLCTQALANNGNSYNLYKRLCERGYITPVLFKNLAVYTTRGSIAHPTDYIDWFLIPPANEAAEG